MPRELYSGLRPDPNAQLGNANATDGALSSADANAPGEDSVAQDGQTNVYVPDANLQFGDANASDGSTASNGLATGGANSPAQDGLLNFNVPDANLFGAEADGTGSVAMDGQTNVFVPDATLLLGKANADDGGIASADTTASGERSTAQDGLFNLSIPEANIAGAKADNMGVATWAFQFGDNVGTGNIAKDITNSAVAQGSVAVNDANDFVISDGGPAVKDQGQVAVGTVAGDINTATPTMSPSVNGLQTVALTDLTQVNAGIYIGNNSGNSSGYLTANSTNSATNGVMTNASSFGGVASNVAAQNVVNVSANINQVGSGEVSP